MNILQLGIKEWPYRSGIKESKNRGGGTGKYCELLFKSIPINKVTLFIVTRRLNGQLQYEVKGNKKIYRSKSLSGRRLRHLSLAASSFFQSIKILKKEKIDVIHSHMFVSNLIAIIIGKIFKVPVIIVPHGALYHKYLPAFNTFRRRIERFLERIIYPFATKIVMFCLHDIDMYTKLSNKKLNNFVVVPTGFETKKVEEPSFNFENRKIKFLFVGRLLKLKSLDKLLIAINELNKEEKDNILFDIVGEGDEIENLEYLVRTNNLESIVVFHGYIQDPVDFYKNADVFCLLSDTEGQSLALMEAMSYYNACLINDFGVPYSDDSLIILENNSKDEIVRGIRKLISNPQLIKYFALNGRFEVESFYSSKEFASNYLKLYQLVSKY
tara:strand:+ start:872 stop:2020 length:1149 start_codon:yes stop_codon:yes gene_type:complete